MRALWEIFIKEMADGFVSKKTWMILLLCCGLIPPSVLVHQRAVRHLAAEQEQARVRYEQAQEEAARRYPELGGKIPADELTVKVFRGMSEMAAWGRAGGVPEVVAFTLGGRHLETGGSHEGSPLALWGGLDLVLIVQFVLSLVAVALTFNAVCGEREAGTLKLMLAHGAPRGQILLGKVSSAWLTLAVPFSLAFGLTLVLLRFAATGSPPGGGTAPRLLALVAVMALYLGFFLHLGLLVSSLTARSLTALVALLFLWVAMTAVIPQGAGLLARAVYPVESSAALEQRKRLLAENLDAQLHRELRPHAGRADYEQLRGELAETYRRRFDEEADALEAARDARQAVQERIAVALASLSPTPAFLHAVTTLTGGGPAEDRHFQQQLRKLERELRATVFAGTYRDLFAAGQARGRIRLVDPRQLPELADRPLGTEAVLREVAPSGVFLLLADALLLAAALAAFRRYDVR